MTHVEVLERSVELPLELNAIVGRHEGVPVGVLSQYQQIEPGCLFVWNDEVSQTIGLAHKNHVVMLKRDDVLGFALNFMRPAKSSGLVTLDVSLRSQRNWLNLLHSSFSQEAGLDN